MTLASGSTFGPYQILDPLGRGGMAAVYRAYEPGLDRQVALKVLPNEFLHDPGFAERFSREAKVVARLEHPNIIPIHNFGIEEQSKTPWMAMRLIAGGALSSLMKKERIPAARVVVILHGVAEALDYAHAKGVVHRDVKPQNILLDDHGRVYLADFGIAKMVEGSSGLTQTGMISGTPQYMAPEQAMGGTVDNRADIYALGIVAYEMLTGRVPFAADTPVAVLMKHVQDPIPVPAPTDVPEPIVRALFKALAKRPEERWGTAVAFADALKQGLQEAKANPAGLAATTMIPVEQRTPQRGVPAVQTGAGMVPPTLPPAAYPGVYPGGAVPVPYPQGTPSPGTHPAVTAVPGHYPMMTPAPGTYPAMAPPGTYPPGTYPPGQYPTGTYPPGYPAYPPGTPPPGTYPGLPYAPQHTYVQRAPEGPGRGLIVGIVAVVVVAGVIGTAVLLVLLRARSADTADTRPDMPPVTMRSPQAAEPEPPYQTVPVAPVASTDAETTPLAEPSPITTRPTLPRVAEMRPVETTLAAPPPVTAPAPPPAEPAVPARPPSMAAFPGAGVVTSGPKFFEKTLVYSADQMLPFQGQVGSLKVPGLQFAVAEKTGRDAGLKVSLRAMIPVDCPQGAGEWDYNFKIDLLDENGRQLEQMDNSGSCENQIKTVRAEKSVVKALIPSIRGVKVRFQAEKD